jgi:hypothetical protein
MSAISRWVRFPISASTYIMDAQYGTPGVSRGTGNTADSFTIAGSANNQLKVSMDGEGTTYQVTLTSGASLDPRFVAKDIQRKIQALAGTVAALYEDGYKYCQAEFTNMDNFTGAQAGLGQFYVRSGTTGTASQVTITDGDSSVLTLLGLNNANRTETAGTVYHRGTTTQNSASWRPGTITMSGTYQGAFDDIYTVITSATLTLPATGTAGGGNTFGVANAGVCYVTGDWNYDSNTTYTITIDTTNGSTMGGGTGNVPTFVVNSSSTDDIVNAQELLYPNTYYALTTRGVYAKFTDYPFGNGDTFTIAAVKPVTVDGASATGAVGVAKVVWTSLRGDNATVAKATAETLTSIGTKGLSMAWAAGTLTARDEWRVFCRSPTPEAYGVTSMDYGNVTVTTNSAVKCHQFEIQSGAVTMTSVKFSLQNHGTFSHHDAGNDDTEFHFGTVGAGARGDGTGGAGTGPEWPSTAVTASDISVDKTGGNTGAPTSLYAAKDNLSVVASADSAEAIGNVGLVSDFVFTAIQLGSSETGANSTVNMRLYFDYSS